MPQLINLSSELINNEESLRLKRFQRANPIFHLGENGRNSWNKMDAVMSPLLYLNMSRYTVLRSCFTRAIASLHWLKSTLIIISLECLLAGHLKSDKHTLTTPFRKYFTYSLTNPELDHYHAYYTDFPTFQISLFCYFNHKCHPVSTKFVSQHNLGWKYVSRVLILHT